MKKRTYCMLVCLSLLIVLLGGCFGDGAGVQTVVSDGGEASGGTDSDARDFFTQNGQGVLPKQASIPAFGKPTRNEHLYELPFDLPSFRNESGVDDGLGAELQFFFCGDTVHALYYDVGHYYRVMSAADGSLLTEQHFARKGNGGPLADGGFWIVEYNRLKVDFYTVDGTKTKILSGDPAYEGTRAPDFAMVTSDGKYMMLSFDSDRPFLLLELETGKKTRVTEEGRSEQWTLLSAQGTSYLFGGSKGGLLSIDTATDTYEQIDGKDPVCEAYGGLHRLSGIESGVILRGNDGDKTALFGMFFEDEDETALSVGFGCLATVCRGEVRFYDLRAGKRIASCKLGDRYYHTRVTFTESGAAFISATNWGEPVCYLFDLPAAAEPTEDVESCFYETNSLRELMYGYAEEIGEAHGIEIYCGSEGNDFFVDGYVGVAETDPSVVFGCLQTIERVLARYPEGMIEESYRDIFDGMKLYLCSSLFGVGDEGLGQAGGLTTHDGTDRIVILDVYNGLEATLSHELSHVFDARIEYVSDAMGVDWIEIWESLAPSEDAYLYTYDDYFDYEEFTPAGEADGDNVWFAESYGRTFPTEDRATLMECMVADADSYNAELLEYDNLAYKAELYCLILRTCFVSCDVEEELYWEQHLGIPDADKFADLVD